MSDEKEFSWMLDMSHPDVRVLSKMVAERDAALAAKDAEKVAAVQAAYEACARIANDYHTKALVRASMSSGVQQDLHEEAASISGSIAAAIEQAAKKAPE